MNRKENPRTKELKSFFPLSLTSEEKRKLKELAEYSQSSMQGVIRTMIEEEYSIMTSMELSEKLALELSDEKEGLASWSQEEDLL